jgi:hypothetical protein
MRQCCKQTRDKAYFPCFLAYRDADLNTNQHDSPKIVKITYKPLSSKTFKMSNLAFTSSEIRLATLTLTSLAALIPAIYLLWPTQKHSSKQQHMATFNAFIKSYSTLRPQALTTHASRDFKYTGLPLSLGMPSRTLRPFQSHAALMFSLYSDFAMIPQDNANGDAVHFSHETNTVIAHCKLGGNVNTAREMGAKLGVSEWWTECVLFVRLSKDGKRVEEVREFVDSAKAEDMRRRLGNVLEEGVET